ncbi:MAG: amino acid adenylation domain-containing protein, partial [Nitrososphaerales archaeon]
LQQVKQITIDGLANQDLPFEHLVEVINPQRSLSHHPIFQVMFVLQNAPNEVISMDNLELNPIKVETTTTKFDLTLSAQEIGDSLMLELSYYTDLFSHETIERFINHYEVLLHSVVAEPNKRLTELNILTQSERDQILNKWNITRVEYDRSQCIHKLFETQAEKNPSATAVIFAGKQLTYRELNHKTNQLAHYLQQHGVNPETLVGICIERSLEMIIGILGILKAGGAYVPIDPNYPKERIEFMLDDAKIKILLTQHNLISALAKTKIKTICLDNEWSTIAAFAKTNLVINNQSSDLAYVIYTSGSTGKPKGVMIEHRKVLNYINWLSSYCDIRTNKLIDCSSSLSFDLTVTTTIGPLVTGQTVVICSDDIKKDPSLYHQYLVDNKINLIKLTPSYFNNLLNVALESDGLQNLKRILLGGEAASKADIKKWLQIYPQHIIHNEYGPTETTVAVSEYALTDTTIHHTKDLVPIGKPAYNSTIYILNNQLQPVPIGILGEIYIGGVGLSRGYLNRQQLTNEKFIVDPFSQDSHDRLYKSGDLARYLPDGNIEYIGRIDNQVKIRGFRIELGEIDAVLTEHPAISQALVIADEDKSGDKRLVAYVVKRDNINLATLQSFIKEKLPDYMVPSVFMFLDLLPLTPNGKIDRNALPKPELVRDINESFLTPTTATEKQIAEIWQSLLSVNVISVNDNFFDLGGHSLLSIKAI